MLGQVTICMFFIAILLTSATEGSSSAMYLSAITQKPKVTPATTQPSNAKAYGDSVAMCSFACQQDQPDFQCEAFRLSETNECTFDEIQDCALVIREEVASEAENVEKIWYDKTKYAKRKVIEMQTTPGPAGSVQPKDVHNETQCTDLLTMPTPQGGNFNSVGGHADYKGGIIVCSGHGNKKCQYWIPGMANWEYTQNDMKYVHRDSGACALGWGEIMIVGNPLGEAKSEILQKNGDWFETKPYPVGTRYLDLHAKNSHVVYGIGGEESVSGANNPRKSIYRYDRFDDEWTKMDDMPVTRGGSDPNCIKVYFRGKDVILCFGATFEEGQMLAFDLETEKWEDTGITAPTPPHFDSLLFVTGDLLYRYRGYTGHEDISPGNQFQPVDTVDYFNLKDETWSTQTTLSEPYNDHFHRHIFTTEVIYKLAP